MNSLSRTAQTIVSSILLLASVNSGWSSGIPLIAMTDTNNPQTIVGRFSLTESNLQFDTYLPPASDVQIMCSSNGIVVGGVVWKFLRRVIPQTNDVIIPLPPPILIPSNALPPILILTNPVVIPLPPPILILTNPVIIPPNPIFVPPIYSGGVWIEGASASPIPFRTMGTLTAASELVSPTAPNEIVTNVVFWPPMPTQIEVTAEQGLLFRDGFGLLQFEIIGASPTTGFIRQVDSDNDGVPDPLDHCLGTEPGSLVDSEGCSIEQSAPCDGAWRNHGDFVSSFKAVTSYFLRSGLITPRQCRELNAAAAQADCGKSR